MAQFGAKRPRFAPVATTPAGALPTYTYEKAVTIGKLVQANLTVTNASGELYADDGLAEKLDMFASGSLELQTDDKTAEVHAALHGATLDEESDEVTDLSLVRRQFGYTPGEIPNAQTFALLVEPYRLGALKNAVIRAITIGYGREITAPGDDEYDEGLAELHQKKTRLREPNTSA